MPDPDANAGAGIEIFGLGGDFDFPQDYEVGGSGAGVDVEEDNVAVGTATTIDFGAGLDVAFAAGEADVTVDLSEVAAFTDHSARHENGGADEISLAGLDGTPVELTNHLGDTVDAHDASAISADSTTLAGIGTDVQAVLEELDNAIEALRALDFLVGTATGELSGEIVAGTSPGGELGGTWASPTVDATHSGSAHHTQSHDHSAAGDGQTLTPGTLNIPHAAAPAPTAEGQAAWDDDDNFLRIGDGAASKDFFPTVDATSDPLAVSTAAADGTEKTTARKDHVHAHEAAHINHDTTWAAKGDLIAATGNDAAAVVTVGADGKHLKADSGAASGVSWEAETLTIGLLINGGGSAISTGTHPVWRAPFACTVVAVRGYVDTGTTTVINAGKNDASSADFCSSDITIDPADAWENGTVNQNTALSAGDTIYIQVVTAGTATELTVQVEVTRP